MATRQLKQELLTFDNDASACYDRIIPVLALMASRRVGMPLLPCVLVANVLSSVIYSTKVGPGLAEGTYQHTITHPIYGTGQGSCALPVFWLLLSLILITVLRKHHVGMKFSSPNGTMTAQHPIDRLVDGTTIGTNEAGELESLLQAGAKIAQEWESLLFLSGGTLVKKCLFLSHWLGVERRYWENDGSGGVFDSTHLQRH